MTYSRVSHYSGCVLVRLSGGDRNRRYDYSLKQLEQEAIIEALERNGWNKSLLRPS